MTIEKLVEKLNYYKNLKSQVENERQEKLGAIEQKVLEYRLELSNELENSVKEYAKKLHDEFEAENTSDLAKVDNYIELLENLIKEIADNGDEVNE